MVCLICKREIKIESPEPDVCEDCYKDLDLEGVLYDL